MKNNFRENIGQAARSVKSEDFDYDLPEGKIAKYPVPCRDESKLLVWENGEVSQSLFKHIPAILPTGAFLVFNNTKVVRARLFFLKETGARIEIFCLEPFLPADYQLSFRQAGSVEWKCMVGNARKWKSGKLTQTIRIDNSEVFLSAEIVKKEKEDFIIRFEWGGGFTFSEVIENAGAIPIPPYLKRKSEETDNTRYQTVYARDKGSVAAPTAGLHFTQQVLGQLKQKGIKSGELTLHVGAGTFHPVKSETIGGHTMHNESVAVSLEFLKKLASHREKVIAIGTTSIRSLESLYWLGVQLMENPVPDKAFHVSQWEPYEKRHKLTPQNALALITGYMEKNNLKEFGFSTQLIIVPGYEFKIIDGMLTNFHQPRSTLLMLITAFLGNDWQKVYRYALENNFRFLSYGDSNLYLK